MILSTVTGPPQEVGKPIQIPGAHEGLERGKRLMRVSGPIHI